jgi:hypothetical protein
LVLSPVIALPLSSEKPTRHSVINTQSFAPTPIRREAQSLLQSGIVHIPSKNSHIQPDTALALFASIKSWLPITSITPSFPGCAPAQKVNQKQLQYHTYLESTIQPSRIVDHLAGSESGELTESETLEAPTGFWACLTAPTFS